MSACALAVLTVGLRYQRQQRVLDTLAVELDTTRSKAQRVRASLDKLGANHANLSRLRVQKRDAPSLLDIWEEVTRVLPSHSWLTELRLSDVSPGKEQQIVITGLSPVAASLVGLLDRSPMFRGGGVDRADLNRPERRQRAFCHSSQGQELRPPQDGWTMKQAWQHPSWLRHVLFAGINLAAGFVAVAFIVLPIGDGLARRDAQIVEQRAMLDRFRALAGQEAAVDAAAEKLPADTGEYLTGNNEGVINADLQTRLKGMVEPVGARLRSGSHLAGADYRAGQVHRLPHQNVSGPLPAIHRAVAAIETSRPYLFVRAAVIKPAPPAKPDIPQEPVIEAQLDVFGAVRNAGGPSDAFAHSAFDCGRPRRAGRHQCVAARHRDGGR